MSKALAALNVPRARKPATRAERDPVAPAPSPAAWAMLGWARREIGHADTPAAIAKSAPTTTVHAQTVSATMDTMAATDSPLATPEQLAAEKVAAQTVNTLPVKLMKGVLKVGFLFAAHQQFPGGPNAQNLAELDNAVDEFALAAAFQQQILNPLTPAFVTQVAPPHTWFGQSAGGTRILYDNPDTIYRFTGISASSEYVIRGQFHDVDGNGQIDENEMPADTSFSVLEGIGGTTTQILTVDDDFEINEDGTFEITVSAEPAAPGQKNHLQLTPGSTLIASRNTLGDWNEEQPMSLSIERVAGPPNSLFAQLGGFTFLGPVVNGNKALTSLVSIIPPVPNMPPVVRGTFTALILIVRGVNQQAKYMGLATAGAPNVISQPASNAEFLANQKQSNGHYELADDEALVVTIDPGDAGYFIVPTYNDWTITDNYWDRPTSLNNEQMAVRNADGTYTVVISPTDPGAANWVSTGGLNQGLVSIRFQNIGGDPANAPRIVDQQVMTHDELREYLPAEDFVTPAQRQAQLDARKAGFDKRWAPYVQV
ncbi:DUF1214 domain-containing protein [Mycobacterium sp. 21AC1]|uniref:DUF1214 domain-containing protein n=1 Tax=[Mycobacterium] appelbergii TaxID=2939269 RepID=UPI002938CF57|nr:DUF1214 domain-containing protein [Mycobacterium sp. 21AC1]MDV3125445.1 DUF1214 domain-containing protein [Mycobacterium sp. 21AC1]